MTAKERYLAIRTSRDDVRSSLFDLPLSFLQIAIRETTPTQCRLQPISANLFVLAVAGARHYVRSVATEAWLKTFLSDHGGVAGTVHLLDGELLRLSSAVNIPPPVVKITETIPKGKGMAGLAWERDEVSATCHLKCDNRGDVRPDAKAVAAPAALAMPVLSAAGSLRAVVGIAFMGERNFSTEQLHAFETAAASLPHAG